MDAVVWPASMACAICIIFGFGGAGTNQSLTGSCRVGYNLSGVCVERVQCGKGEILVSPVILMPSCCSIWKEPSRVALKYGATHARGVAFVRPHPARSTNEWIGRASC